MIEGNIGDECSKRELDMSVMLPIQTAIESSQWITIEAPSKDLDNSSFSFKIGGDSVHYIDLSDMQLSITAKLQKNGVDVTATDGVSYVNNILHSAFKNIIVKIGQVLLFTIIKNVKF